MYYSQDKQDEILNTNIFKGFRNGVVVDVGAWDGVCFSNSFFFEKECGWKSINIEPLEDRFNQLVINRPSSINLNIAVHSVDGEADFLSISGNTSMLSGIKANYDPRHITRIENELNELHNESKIVRVHTKRLDTIFREQDIKHVNYLSIDVEGSEMDVIRSIDFNRVFIDVIGFENNYPDKTQPIIDYLKKQNYSRFVIKCDDVFMVHNRSHFRPSFTAPNLPFRVL
jgi:FkbM family methyltransferase